MPKITLCEICGLLSIKYVIRNKNWAILKICQLCMEEYRLNGIEPIIVETIKDFIEVEEIEGRGIF